MATRPSEVPILRLTYETEDPLLASEVAVALQALDKLFKSYAISRRYRGAQLALKRIEARCLILDLIALVDGISTVNEHKDLLAGFVTHLVDIVKILSGLKPGKVKPTDRKAIGGVYSPVAKKHSTQLNIHIVGDHNQVVITPETLDLIEQRDRREQKRADDELSAIIVPTESHVPRLLKPGSFGTAIDHKGTWYVRLEGDGGVLRPADLAPGVMLKDDQSYSFEGYRVGPRYLITAAQPIG